MNKKEAVAKLVRLYTEQQSLDEQIKDIKTEAKESGLNVAILATVAKALASGKATELKEKSTDIVDTIDEVM
jgi:uncharacterized protein (UPF0335 family)